MDTASHETSTEFYEEVASLLEFELGHQPHRSDLRYKLLEVYAATHRHEDFLREARHHFDAESSAGNHDSYRARIVELGRRLAPDDPLFRSENDDDASNPERGSHSTSRRFYESFDPAELGPHQARIQKAFDALRRQPGFWRDLRRMVNAHYQPANRLTHAQDMSRYLGGAQIFVRNDVNRELNEAAMINAYGQAMIAKHLQLDTLISAAAGGGHIEALAHAAKAFDMKLVVYATERDQVQQKSRLSRIALDGVSVQYVGDGPSGIRSEGQRHALAAALDNPDNAFYLSPVDAGPHPYPMIVQDLLGMAGRELRIEIMSVAGQLPTSLIVSDADSMNAVGYLQAFLEAKSVQLTCVRSYAPHRRGRGRLAREHAWLNASGRVQYTSVADEVARFIALNFPVASVDKMRLSGGEVLAETILQARQMDAASSIVAVLPVAPPLATLN